MGYTVVPGYNSNIIQVYLVSVDKMLSQSITEALNHFGNVTELNVITLDVC